MKRNLVTILLLVCSVLLLVGSVVLYRALTSENSGSLANPAVGTSSESTASEIPQQQPDDSMIIIGSDPDYTDGATAEIVEDDSILPPASDFTFTDRNGTEYHLSDFYGKPIIINFWATWCPPCREELPYFNEAYANYGTEIQFLMMDLVDGYNDTEESVISFAASNGYNFPLYFDSRQEGSLAYGVSAIPFTVAINANGRIVETHLGSLSSAELQELLDTLRNES